MSDKTGRIALGLSSMLVAAGLSATFASAAFAATDAVPTCASADLTAAFTVVDHASGHTYGDLVLTNTGDACSLSGYPDLSYVDADGATVGRAAAQLAGTPATVILKPGASTTAQLRVTNYQAYDETECAPTAVAGISVLAPATGTAILLDQPGTTCSGDVGGSLLAVGPIGTSF